MSDKPAHIDEQVVNTDGHNRQIITSEKRFSGDRKSLSTTYTVVVFGYYLTSHKHTP